MAHLTDSGCYNSLWSGRHTIFIFLTIAPVWVNSGGEGDLSEKSSLHVGNESINSVLPVWDTNGYVLFCPCHGRFGNQADQFLGSIDWAKALNRTLVLPPWRSYSGQQKFIPFDKYFQVNPLKAFHRVILAQEFVEHLAPIHWPMAQRAAFCFIKDGDHKPCTVSDEFFQEFWRFIGVPTFNSSENIGGLHFETDHADEWKKRFPPDVYPVISLRGPPARFPSLLSQWPLQRFLVWSTEIRAEAEQHISRLFHDQPYLGIHLRNGEDWAKACAMLDDNRHGLTNLMASAQCIGEHPAKPLSKDLCFPSEDTVFHVISQILTDRGLRHVYIATDAQSYISQFSARFPTINFVRLNPSVPQIDLYILERSFLFVGNCVSSFTSFVRRQRDVAGLQTLYFGMPGGSSHNEL